MAAFGSANTGGLRGPARFAIANETGPSPRGTRPVVPPGAQATWGGYACSRLSGLRGCDQARAGLGTRRPARGADPARAADAAATAAQDRCVLCQRQPQSRLVDRPPRRLVFGRDFR